MPLSEKHDKKEYLLTGWIVLLLAAYFALFAWFNFCGFDRLALADMYEDTNIIRFLRLASYLQPIRTLMSDSDVRLETALESDKDLKNLYIVMQSMTDAVLDDSAEGNEE